jgi:hypothetical protein
MKFLKLIRYDYLILLAFTQLIFRYGFLELQPNLPMVLNDWQYLLLVLASVLIAAGGAIMEAISGPDKHNQIITEEKGYNIYMAVTLTGIALGGYIAHLNMRIEFIAAFVVAAAMLYIAVTNFRTTLLVPNFLIAITAALSIIIIGIFNFYPFMSLSGSGFLKAIFEVILDYAYFAFVIAFLHTLVSDQKNTDSDYNSGKTTLPIVLGRDRAARILFFITIIPAAMVLYYVNSFLLRFELMFALGYVLLFVLAPLIYFAIKLWTAKTPKDFEHLAIVLKIVILFAAVSIAVVTYNITNNA